MMREWQGTECTDRLSGSYLLTSHLSAAALSREEVESCLLFPQLILTSLCHPAADFHTTCRAFVTDVPLTMLKSQGRKGLRV